MLPAVVPCWTLSSNACVLQQAFHLQKLSSNACVLQQAFHPQKRQLLMGLASSLVLVGAAEGVMAASGFSKASTAQSKSCLEEGIIQQFSIMVET